MRATISLVTGLAVGAVGAVMFMQSMPPPEGSAEERAGNLQAELKRASNRISALEAADPHGRRRPGRTLSDSTRSLADDWRDGKPITPDDLLRATQPLIRDLAPLFDRIRERDFKWQADTLAGGLARKYELNESQREALEKWLETRAGDEAKRFGELVGRPGTSIQDLAEFGTTLRLDDGIENFMERTLRGEKLAAFKSGHMLERVDRVQREADGKVERLNQIVGLDDNQRGQIFGLMARNSRDFDPAMQFEGLGTGTATPAPGQPVRDAVLAVLTEKQRQAYQAKRQERVEDARKEMEVLGLSLPEGDAWFGFDDF